MSVVIPVRNAEETIRACLDSLAFQTRRPDEVIIVENESTDQTVSRVKEWAAEHADLHPRVVTETRQGPSAARNAGAKVAKGDVLIFLDADCVAPSHWLQGILDEVCHGLDAVGGPYQGHVSIPAIEKYAATSWSLGRLDQEFSFSSPFISRFLLGGNMALFRRHWEKVGGFDETLHAGEDLDLSFRLKKEGVTMKYIPHLAVTHQIQTSFSKRLRRAFSHGILQSKIAKRYFRNFLTFSIFQKSWKFPFPFTITIEVISLTKLLCLIALLGWTQPFLAVALLLILTFIWEFRMVHQLVRFKVRFTFLDCLSILLGWAVARLAMEVGRLAGSVRYQIFCW